MKIRIGDRVRVKRDGLWGTVVRCRNWSHWGKMIMYLIRLDAGVFVDRTTRQIEKLPRYRGLPQSTDTATAHRHLQEYLR